MTHRRTAFLAALTIATLSACAPAATDDDAAAGDAQTVTVDSTADECTLSTTTVTAGEVTFAVTNSGDDETEFYLYAADGEDVVSEVEDIGPGLTRELTVDLEAGDYVTACKPGMTGDGIRGDLTVTE
jgi:iron uptake system component EfeO